MPLCIYISFFGRAGQASETSAEFEDSGISILISQRNAWASRTTCRGREVGMIKGLEKKPFDFIGEGNITLPT